jgi:hypothetical protein
MQERIGSNLEKDRRMMVHVVTPKMYLSWSKRLRHPQHKQTQHGGMQHACEVSKRRGHYGGDGVDDVLLEGGL